MTPVLLGRGRTSSGEPPRFHNLFTIDGWYAHCLWKYLTSIITLYWLVYKTRTRTHSVILTRRIGMPITFGSYSHTSRVAACLIGQLELQVENYRLRVTLRVRGG